MVMVEKIGQEGKKVGGGGGEGGGVVVVEKIRQEDTGWQGG